MKNLLRLVVSSFRRTVVGSIDGIHRGCTRGWAIDLANPTSRLSIRMVDATGRELTRGVADRYRVDVQKAGYGDGHSGFALQVADPRIVERARILCGTSGTELPASRRTSGAPSNRVITRGSYALFFDQRPTGPAISGWAIDRNHPQERRMIRLRVGQRTLAQQRATLYRADSIEATSDGFHGFALSFGVHYGPLFLDDLAGGLEFRLS